MAAKSTPSFVEDPGRIRGLTAAIAAGRLSPVELVERYLQRIDTAEAHVAAWRVVDRERARAEAEALAQEAKAGRVRGPLHGLPIAIKDIIDVEGLPTRCNSVSRANVAPATADAEIVLQLRRQGALILGKVHTTEFAFFDPSPARNPHNPEHTPGGSSSGSAAAVAAGMVPAALGTQTVASVNRPAAYCGIAAFKPSTRSTITSGIAPLAASYDTVGFYGFKVDDAVTLYEAARSPFAKRHTAPASPRQVIVIPEDPHLSAATADAMAALDRLAGALSAAGHMVARRPSPVSFERLFNLQRSTMLYEAGRHYRYAIDLAPGQIGEKFLAAVRDGLAMPFERYVAEARELATLGERVLAAFVEADAFLWPAAPGTAPKGLAWTGDPRFISPWTAIGGPIVTIPTGAAADGLPLGCILMAAPGRDAEMCSLARSVGEIAERTFP